MKVRLQNPHADDGSDYRYSLTVGHEYEVLGIEADHFRLMNDKGEPILYQQACFVVTDATEPNFWISTYGEDGERYANPPGWGVPGFYEAWHDGVKVVQRLFAEQLKFWYPNVGKTD